MRGGQGAGDRKWKFCGHEYHKRDVCQPKNAKCHKFDMTGHYKEKCHQGSKGNSKKLAELKTDDQGAVGTIHELCRNTCVYKFWGQILSFN